VHPDRLLRLGFVTELLSKPIRYGYMNGIALTVLISQLPKLFGFSIESAGRCATVRDRGAVAGPGQLDRVRVGAGTLARSCCSSLQAIPGILIAVVAATLAVGVLRPGHAPA
jgi:MFS superfamily sulfate permease-like transporter